MDRLTHRILKQCLNAASVHLMNPVASRTRIEALYTALTAIEAPTATLYMARGWHRGNFGMQVNSPTQRKIIFSV